MSVALSHCLSLLHAWNDAWASCMPDKYSSNLSLLSLSADAGGGARGLAQAMTTAELHRQLLILRRGRSLAQAFPEVVFLLPPRSPN